ncbi:hypothetical protein AMJ86_05545 [bacterium SM23_57]|nr:MAG: hypothetical protein AMJ86_05545 [bacterium SM23_57]
MLKPFPGFKSLKTHHCVTGSMLHVFRYHDIPVSEEMLLGLGSGLGFIYWHQKGVDPFIGGRANVGRPGEEGLEITASKRLGIRTGSFYTTSTKKAEKTLLGFLNSSKPVMLQVDMGYLPYFDFGGEEYHFGYHVIVVAGYNPENRDVLIADRDLPLHLISWDDLVLARGSTHRPFPPKNHWYTFDFSEYHPPRPNDVILSIQEVSMGMLEPPISNLGARGIRKAANRILKWPDLLGVDGLRRTCFNSYIFIDARGGTGGGIFRMMYGRFLKEASAITGLSSLMEIGDRLIEIGDHWQEVGILFHRGFEEEYPAVVLPEISETMLSVADEEQMVWEDLISITRKHQ